MSIKTKAVGYVRSNIDIEPQEQALRSICESNNVELVRVFRDSTSGIANNPPGLTSLLDYLYDNKDMISLLVVPDLGRISRDITLTKMLKFLTQLPPHIKIIDLSRLQI